VEGSGGGYEVAKRRNHRTIHRRILRYSYASLGYAEQGNWAVESHTRTLMQALGDEIGRPIMTSEPIFAWLMRHAGWLLTRYRVRPDGRTSYQPLHREDYRGEVLIVGELCWVLDPRPELAALKGDSRWSQGLWLGKVEASDEHIVGLGATVSKTRTVRRLPEDQRWSTETVDQLRALPWGDAGQVTDAARTTKRHYITRAAVDQHGATEGCRGCTGESKWHSTRCAARFAEIFESQEADRAARFPQTAAESAAEPQEAGEEAQAGAAEEPEAPLPQAPGGGRAGPRGR
jgi:hypothetical protein